MQLTNIQPSFKQLNNIVFYKVGGLKNQLEGKIFSTNSKKSIKNYVLLNFIFDKNLKQ